jgi:hypothetical protein
VSRFSKKSGDPGPLSHTGELCADQGRPPTDMQGLPAARQIVDATASIYRQIYSRCSLAQRPAAHGQHQVLVRRRWELTGTCGWTNSGTATMIGPAVAPTEENKADWSGPCLVKQNAELGPWFRRCGAQERGARPGSQRASCRTPDQVTINPTWLGSGPMEPNGHNLVLEQC